jgi:hypothetical protein
MSGISTDMGLARGLVHEMAFQGSVCIQVRNMHSCGRSRPSRCSFVSSARLLLYFFKRREIMMMCHWRAGADTSTHTY